MDESAGAWNLASLKSVLTMGLKDPLPGVNTPYCYIGSWKTFFCWHTEDMELSAINFLHFGKPKFWYGVCSADRKILEKEAHSHFYENFQKCPEYMRHKTSVINPYMIKARNPSIRISKYNTVLT
jgi:jumonji domain-containing protein 2